MKTKSHIGPLITLALPVAASHVSDILVSTADVLMVGPLGAVPLAGVQIATSASLIAMLFAIGFTAAVTPLAGEAFGRNDMAGVAQYSRAGLVLSTLITTVLCALLMAASPRLDLLGAPADVTSAAIPYFRWVVPSFILRILYGSFKQTAEAMSNTRAAMILNLATNLLNVGLNWVFIYGKLGMPEMGAEGAGLATFLARGIAVVGAWELYKRASFFAPLRIALRELKGKKVGAVIYRKILHDGTGIGLQILVEVFAFAAGAIMLGWISATAVAAHSVAINMASLTFMVALGLASAVTIRVSNLRGERKQHEARHASLAALYLVIVYEFVIGLGYLSLRYFLPTLYVDDPAVIDLAAHLLLFAAAFSLFDGLQVVGLGILRGYNDVRIPTIIATMSYVVITIPCSYIFTFVLHAGPAGIWIGYLIGLVVASGGYLWRFLHVVRPHQRTEAEGRLQL